MFNLFKKKIKYDPNPKIKVGGKVFITEVILYTNAGVVDRQILFSDTPVSNKLVLGLSKVEIFLEQFPHGQIRKKEYECELKTLVEIDVRAAK